jgi:hypothetical protein
VKILAALVVVATLAACGSSAPPDTLYDDGNQGAADCPIPATYEGQPGVPGDPCSNAAADCSPACCGCPSGNDSFWASECQNGVCLDDTDTCNNAPSATYCN